MSLFWEGCFFIKQYDLLVNLPKIIPMFKNAIIWLRRLNCSLLKFMVAWLIAKKGTPLAKFVNAEKDLESR